MRCKVCEHKWGKRSVTATCKGGGEARVHKKPCGCECHVKKGVNDAT